MKSQVNALLHVTEGILTDVRLTYPELGDSLHKDLERLTLNAQTRGLELFTLDLPHLESLLVRGLEDGRLDLDGAALTKTVSKSIQVPRLYSGLWMRVFEHDSSLKTEVDVNALFFLRQLLVIGKRIEVVCSSDRIQAKVGEYHDIERRLRKASFDWQYDVLLPASEQHSGTCDRSETLFGNRDCAGPLYCRNRNPYDCDCGSSSHLLRALPEGAESERITGVTEGGDGKSNVEHLPVHLVQAVDHVYPALNDPSDLFSHEYREEDGKSRLEDIRLLNRIQQVADVLFSTIEPYDPVAYSGYLEERSFGTGFKHGPGAVAERLKNWEKSQFPNWPHKLQATFPYELCGKTAGSSKDRPLNHEMASRLICVPKTAKSPRLIAAEPTSHQWCQQGVLKFLFDQCRAHLGVHFIDFKDQSKSGDLVLKASLNRELATVDLSDASDRLTCWTVERICRRNPSLLRALHAARTRYIRDEISDELSFLSLRKFASQGTATTFPVMSLVMLCIALGATLSANEIVTMGTLRKYRDRVRIFGDDIILPRYGYGRLVRAMELLELKVNTAKSYVNGHFRESCGTDGYWGYDITPVKPRTLIADSPASCQAVVDTSNNLFNKGLWNAAITTERLLPVSVRDRLRIVGPHGAGGGLSSYTGSDERHLDKRWNPRLHRYEVRVWAILARTRTVLRNDIEGLLDFFARSYNQRNPRVVSEYLDVRATKARCLWEPSHTDARTHFGYRKHH